MANLRATRAAFELLGKQYALPGIEPHYLPELVDLLLHNWAGGCSISVSWSTDVQAALSGAEERRGLVSKPYRVVSARWTALGRKQASRLWSLAHRCHGQRLVVPVYPDRSRLTANSAAGTSTLHLDTRYRRFQVGGRAAVFHVDSANSVVSGEIVRIAAVSPSSLTVATPLQGAWSAGPGRAVPLVEVEIVLDSSARVESDRAFDLSLDLSEVSGASSLHPWIAPGNLPPAETYRQVPIFPFRPDWSQGITLSMRRDGDRKLHGRSTVTDPTGSRTRDGFQFSLRALTRPIAFQCLEWLDSLRGRLCPFWLVDPLDSLEPIGFTGSTLDVAGHTFLTDAERFLPYVAVLTSDGRTHVRQVGNISDPGGVNASHRLALVEPIYGYSEGDVRGARRAFLSRLASDTYVENWQTDTALTVSLSTIELLAERTAIIVTRDALVPAAGLVGIQDLHLAVLSPFNLTTPAGGIASVDGAQVGGWQDALGGTSRSLITQVPIEQAYATRQTMGPRVNLRVANLGASGEKSHFRAGQAEPIYSNAKGMTIAMAVQRHTGVGHSVIDDFLLGYTNAAGSAADIIYWTSKGVQLWEDSGVLDAAFAAATEDLYYPYGLWHVIVLTWEPGKYVKVYKDGGLVGQTPRAPVDLPIGTSDTARRARLCRFANETGSLPGAFDSAINAVVAFRRALHVDELNLLGKYLADRVGIAWNRVIS